MIDSLGLTGFKAFSTLPRLQISPLTVISGVNSSGKSSIIHSLLLLKQSLESDTKDAALLLNGRYLQYPGLRDATFGVPQAASASISYTFMLPVNTDGAEAEEAEVVIEFRQKETTLSGVIDRVPRVNCFKWRHSKNDDHHKIKLHSGKYRWPSSAPLDEIPAFLQQTSVRATGANFVQFDRFLPSNIEQEWIQTSTEESSSQGKMIGLLPLAFGHMRLHGLVERIRADITSLRYLGPVRATPRRAYVHYSPRDYDLSSDGSNAAQILWLMRDKNVKWMGQELKLAPAVNSCLGLLGFTQRVEPSHSSRIVYKLDVDTASTKKKVSIADVGFGYSQVLPIILRGLLAPPRSIIIFEQPEIHLHPASKARLADLFIGFMRTGRRIVVETHSTEIINRLRLLTIREPQLAEDVAVSFVTPPEGDGSGARVATLKIDPNGMLDSWPPGFCDESEKTAQEIIMERANRSPKHV